MTSMALLMCRADMACKGQVRGCKLQQPCCAGSRQTCYHNAIHATGGLGNQLLSMLRPQDVLTQLVLLMQRPFASLAGSARAVGMCQHLPVNLALSAVKVLWACRVQRCRNAVQMTHCVFILLRVCAGQGLNQGLEDAAALGQQVQAGGLSPASLRSFETSASPGSSRSWQLKWYAAEQR